MNLIKVWEKRKGARCGPCHPWEKRKGARCGPCHPCSRPLSPAPASRRGRGRVGGKNSPARTALGRRYTGGAQTSADNGEKNKCARDCAKTGHAREHATKATSSKTSQRRESRRRASAKRAKGAGQPPAGGAWARRLGGHASVPTWHWRATSFRAPTPAPSGYCCICAPLVSDRKKRKKQGPIGP